MPEGLADNGGGKVIAELGDTTTGETGRIIDLGEIGAELPGDVTSVGEVGGDKRVELVATGITGGMLASLVKPPKPMLAVGGLTKEPILALRLLPPTLGT